MVNEIDIISGVVLNEEVQFSLREICGVCGIPAELVIDMVSEGVVEPLGAEPHTWHFGGTAVKRIQTALRLQRDLRVNLAGAALALDLLEELEELRCLRDRISDV